MISIICPYNDSTTLENCLIQSLRRQEERGYEVILVDTKTLNISSASQAINYGCSRAKGEYLLIIHQDIVFENEEILTIIKSLCSKLEFGVFGIAGVVVNNGVRTTYSKITHGKSKKAAGNIEFSTVLNAVSLDECAIVIKKEIFDKYHFNNLGKTWHLYATDYSLMMIKNNMNVYIAPIEGIHHKSPGTSMSIDYFDAIQELARINREYRVIYTISGNWPTEPHILFIKCLYRKLRFKLRGY